MTIRCTYLQLKLYLLIAFATLIDAQNINIKCSACRLLVNEIEYKISLADSNKKIQVGSYRVDPHGNQPRLNEIPWARSEQYIHELLDDVCDRSSDYALVRQTTPGAKYIYVRSNDHNKRVYNLPDADKSPKVISKLNSACHDFLDEAEDELIKFLSSVQQSDSADQRFCQLHIGVCSSVDMTPYVLEYESEEKVESNDDEL